MPKNLLENTGIKLSLDEYLNATHDRSSDYKKNNIDIQELSEKEILKYIKEFYYLYKSDKSTLKNLNDFKTVYTNKLMKLDYYNHKIKKMYMMKVF